MRHTPSTDLLREFRATIRLKDGWQEWARSALMMDFGVRQGHLSPVVRPAQGN